MKPELSDSVVEALKHFRDDVKLAWNHFIKRYQFVHYDKKTKQKRILKTCETEDGKYRHPHCGDISYLRERVCWDLLDAYRDPDELWKKVYQEKAVRKEKEKLNRRDYLDWWNKDHKKQWREALENFRRDFSIRH